MTPRTPHRAEDHRSHRVGWLRAAVMGANDGIVSTGSLIVGVAASPMDKEGVLIAGAAALAAGAMSMAAGEYVSVSSQADVERADLAMERRALDEAPDVELAELTDIYTERGVERRLARQVAIQLTEHDDLGAHARDEIGISPTVKARPLEAAWTSASTFTVGGLLPMAAAAAAPTGDIILAVVAASLASLALLGALSAKAGGANVAKAIGRVTFWGAFAMAVTAAIGMAFGAVV